MEANRDLLRALAGGAMHRSASVDMDRAVDEEARTVWYAFSSEEPVQRWDGYEVLDHGKGSVRLGRLQDGAAFLVNHDTTDQVGVVERVEIGNDRRGRALVRFGRSARAEEIFRDVVDGVRRHASFGYWVHAVETEKGRSESDLPTYRVMDWEPFEISTVPVPADATVGVGRSAEIEEPNIQEEPAMENKTPEVDVRQVEAGAVQKERERTNEIRAIAKAHGLDGLADKHITDGTGVDEFRMVALEAIGAAKKVTSTPEVGMSERDVKKFSWLRAVRALANPNDRRAQEDAGFELECSRAAEKATGRAAQGLMVPHDVLVSSQRDLVVGTDASGGYLKGTQHMGSAFIDVLRNKSMCVQMGATQMNGLVGDVAIPKRTAGATAYWLSTEATAITEGANTFGQLSLSPKIVGAYVDISYKLSKQSSPDADMLVQNDIAASLATAIDLAALHGGGSEEPTGIAGTASIGGVAGGTNGAAPTYAHILELEQDVAVANADIGSLGYLTNPKVRYKLKQTYTNATYGDKPIWMGGANGMGEVNGYKAGCTNQVKSTLTKGTSSGVCSAIFFGNWADLILASWGGLDLIVDPYSLSNYGILRIVGLQAVDVGVRHPGSFSVMLDALTA
jgi:HK97 family phage major capsid protein